MSSVLEASHATAPLSEQERHQVREQMERLLETSHFNHSRRYPALLRFIVEETLEGRGDYLKERLIGVSVFHRPADYDTAADPIVRVTIAEIRKRIAQYYHDEAHDAEMRIELLPGRYAPEFRARKEASPDRMEVAPALNLPEPAPDHFAHAEATPALLSSVRTLGSRLFWPAVAGTLALALSLILLWNPLLHWLRPSALEQLWAPVLDSQHPVLFCIPPSAGSSATATRASLTTAAKSQQTPTFLDHESLGENMVFSDALAMIRISGILSVHHHDYRVRMSIATNLNDMREGPAVLIGGLDNQWTLRTTATLPYRFAGSDEAGFWIFDQKHPANRDWLLNLKSPYAAVTRDYALIARVHNEQTGQPEMIVAGIGMSGTAAAGEFLADPGQAEQLRRRIGPGFQDRDFEAVLSTDVVNGSAGSPKILAVSVW